MNQYKQHNNRKTFGTFGGVFTPCFLTILGVILFLRTGMVVGYAGLWQAIAILLLGKTITILTSISLAAIATNTKVKGGGAYFLISRSLGPEFGGAIGLAFFLAQAISVALYVIGFADALASVLQLAGSSKLVGIITVAILFVFAYIGAGWVVKVQYLVMIALVGSLAAFFIGSYNHFDSQLLTTNLSAVYGDKLNFWMVFAIFFPAVTGVMAGANMSGDLENPSRSLPAGTFAAVFVTLLVYALAFLLLAGSVNRQELTGNVFIMEKVAIHGRFFINMGIFAATLSSALGSFIGAPRILQALARDGIFSRLRFFGAGYGRNQEPRRAVVLTFFIAFFGIVAFDLDLIAPVITMFFLITYGVLNFAAFYETKAATPHFRPTFRIYHWSTGLLGAVGCLGVMFLIHWLAALAALIIITAIYRYLQKMNIKADWGDTKSGFLFKQIRDNLLRLERMQYHPKNWRPKILVLSGNPHTRPLLVNCASWLEGRSGLLFVANIIVTNSLASASPYLESQKQNIKKFMAENDFEGLVQVLWSPDFAAGFSALVQSTGIGHLAPNTVMLGLCEDSDKFDSYVKMIMSCLIMKKNVLILKATALPDERIFQRIDIWWRGKENGQLMLLYAFLLKHNQPWANARIRILRIVENEAGQIMARQHLLDLIHAARVAADVEVILSQNPPSQVIASESQQADLVLLGMSHPQSGNEQEFASYLQAIARQLPNVLLVKSAETDIDITQ